MPRLDTKRLFIAIEIPKKIENTLEALESALKESHCDARWVKPANIHITLKFLGGVDMRNINPLIKTLDTGFPSIKKFSVSLDKLDGFASLNSLRILWAGINDQDKKIEKIASELEDALPGFSLKKEEEKFQAHLTLARIRSGKNKIGLIEKIKEINQAFKPIPFAINNITLFESRLTSQGPNYSRIHQVKLISG